ncbi:hypothetical protein AAC387_Pa03g3010 [Persea americana]
MLAMVLLVMYPPLPLSVFTRNPAAASHTCKSSTSIFDIPPDISLPIPTPEHVGVVTDTLLMVMFELGRARLIPYLSHPLFTAAKSSPLSMHAMLMSHVLAGIKDVSRDKDGNYPLLIANIEAPFAAVEMILKHCPDSAELVDRSGRNALHLAALNNIVSTIGSLIKRPEFKMLINQPDNDGNTQICI